MSVARSRLLSLTIVAVSLSGCGEEAKLPVEAGMGPDPKLPAPVESTVPTIDIAPAKGWSGDQKPKAADGLAVQAFSKDLDHPRWLYLLPNGDVLVAETNAPPRPGRGNSVKGWAMSAVMKAAGAGVESPNRITLLRGADGDGTAELKTPFLTGLYSPFGMALIGSDLYVANADGIIKFPYKEGDVKIDAPAVWVAGLPGGPLNHHWTKNIVASKDGTKLYAAVGSNSNIAENGIEKEENRAAILEVDVASGKTRLFASGLRNPVGMAWNPESGALWTAVNERDEIGGDLVPDYMTSVQDGGFYGWPYSYYGQIVDERVQPRKPDMVAKAIKPDYALGPHTASLGLMFYEGNLLSERYKGGAFVGQHGSWNRTPKSGYKVIFVPFAGGKPSGEAQDVLTGFLGDNGEALGRPVGVAADKTGALLVADDVGNVVWRVAPSGERNAAASD